MRCFGNNPEEKNGEPTADTSPKTKTQPNEDNDSSFYFSHSRKTDTTHNKQQHTCVYVTILLIKNMNSSEKSTTTMTSKSMWPQAQQASITLTQLLVQQEQDHQEQQEYDEDQSDDPHHDDNIIIPGCFNYVDSKDPLEIIHVTRLPTGDDDGPHCNWNVITTPVWNARRLLSDVSLHVTGFDLVESKLPCDGDDTKNDYIDFLDSLQVVKQYYPLCESLLKSYLEEHNPTPGAGHDDYDDDAKGPKEPATNVCFVKAFDHNIRIQESSNTDITSTSSSLSDRTLKNGHGSKAQYPIAVCHGDYTHISAPRRVQQLGEPPKTNDVLRLLLQKSTTSTAPEPACDTSLLSQELVQDILHGKKRYAIINVWRSIDREHVVSSFPLACCDTRTVRKDDLRTLQIHYSDRIGENYLVTHEERHKWMYFPSMYFEEAMLIKQWDSEGGIANGQSSDEGHISTFAIHSAFQTPLSSDWKPRQSIEVRCLCVWE